MTNVFFAPGQVEEFVYGFDGAYLIPFRGIPFFFPYIRRARYLRQMHGLSLDNIEELHEHFGEALPDCRFNLFVQFKRPEFIKSSNAKEYPCWYSPYFRYDTTPHQQIALANIQEQSNGRAAVVYASPAFSASQDLHTLSHGGKVVENSNIVSVGLLTSHSRYSYVEAGFAGKAHSEAENINDDSLAQMVAMGLERQEQLPFSKHVKMAASIVEAVAFEGTHRSEMLAALQAIEGDLYTDGSLSKALAMLVAFSDVFETSYYVLG